MNGLHEGQRGQAIVEMAVCMIAIMTVFLGVIFAFAIGSTNIGTLLECRATADNYAYSGVDSDIGRSIHTWTEGVDERLFTNDDIAVTGTSDSPDTFRQELQNESVDLVDGFGYGYVLNNFSAGLADLDMMIFLMSAGLTSHSVTSDPYEQMDLEDLRGAFKTLIFSSDLTITNSVYMPTLDVDETSEDPEP
ncbi:MAG: hypothetical protein JW808_06310 [Victivallales bacterium]|nr:hypothetical protein [Victivallales bacterium]